MNYYTPPTYTHPTFDAAMALLGLTPHTTPGDDHPRYGYGTIGVLSCKHDLGRIIVRASVLEPWQQYFNDAVKYDENGTCVTVQPPIRITVADTTSDLRLYQAIKTRLLPGFNGIIARCEKRKASSDAYVSRVDANTQAAADALGVPPPAKDHYYAHRVSSYWKGSGGGRILAHVHDSTINIEANIPVDIALEVLELLRKKQEQLTATETNNPVSE